MTCHRLTALDQYELNMRNQEFDVGGEMKQRCLGTLVGMGLVIVIVVTNFIGIFSVTW